MLNIFQSSLHNCPDSIAVSVDNVSLSYQELDNRACTLANNILNEYKLKFNQDLEPGYGFALQLPKSCEMFIAILAVWKVGGYFIPIDMSLPTGRIANILQAALPLAEITKSGSLIIEFNDKYAPSFSQDMAYIMFTSGSTGIPKGVLTTHTAVEDRCRVLVDLFKLPRGKIIFGVSPYTFDAITADLYLAWESGGCYASTTDENILDIYTLAGKLNSIKPYLIQTTPSRYKALLPLLKQDNKIQHIICTGEKLGQELAQDLLKYCVQLWSLYGITECCIYSTYKQIKTPEDSLSMGKSLKDVELYLLNSNLELCSTGEEGELYIGGTGISLGYIGNDELTQQKFVNLKHISPRVLYKTQDLVKFIDGEYYFISRLDSHAKLNGQRFDLEEIEKLLVSHELVHQAIVKLLPVKNIEIIVAICKLKQVKDLKNKQFDKKLELYLREFLPEYMLPKLYLKVTEFPLNSNGKVDIASVLPKEIEKYIQSDNQSVWSDGLENAIREIWGESFGFEIKNIDDNFFDIGGTSLLALEVLHKINQNLKANITPGWFYENTTIANQAKSIKQNANSAEKYNPIIAFNESTACNSPLFLFHPSLVSAGIYYRLAKLLSPAISVYGVDSYNLFSGEKMLTKLDEIIDYYLPYIKDKAATGVCSLGGWSHGFLLALKMAEKLQAENIVIEHMFSFDALFFRKFDLYIMEFVGASRAIQGITKMEKFFKIYISSLNKTELAKLQQSLQIDYVIERKFKAKKCQNTVTLFKCNQALPITKGFMEQKFNGLEQYADIIDVVKVDSNHLNILYLENSLQQISSYINSLYLSLLNSYNHH